jgi:hypothetical protein
MARDANCVAAMHRFCESFHSAKNKVAGVSQELGPEVIGVACMPVTKFDGNLNINNLSTHNRIVVQLASPKTLNVSPQRTVFVNSR